MAVGIYFPVNLGFNIKTKTSHLNSFYTLEFKIKNQKFKKQNFCYKCCVIHFLCLPL